MTTPTVDLTLLRLHPRDEADLRWLYEDSAGELGLRSNHETVVNACQGGRNRGSKPVSAARAFGVSDRQHGAAERARRITRRLEQLSQRDQRTLAAAYGGVVLPRATHDDWRALCPAGITPPLLMVAARRQQVTLAVLRGKDKDGKRALALVVGHARVDLAVAGAAYEMARAR